MSSVLDGYEQSSGGTNKTMEEHFENQGKHLSTSKDISDGGKKVQVAGLE